MVYPCILAEVDPVEGAFAVEYLEALKRTWSDIQEAELPGELHEPAFNAGIRYYMGDVLKQRAPAVATSGDPSTSPAMAPRMAPSGDAIARLSAETGTAPEVLDELLYFGPDGTPGINGGARRLGKSKAERTRTIALVLAGARHFANDELEVSVDQIRDVCQELGVYDVNNFAGYVSSVPGFSLSGPKTDRVLRAKGDAAMKFRQRVTEVTGASSSGE